MVAWLAVEVAAQVLASRAPTGASKMNPYGSREVVDSLIGAHRRSAALPASLGPARNSDAATEGYACDCAGLEPESAWLERLIGERWRCRKSLRQVVECSATVQSGHTKIGKSI